jgi:hypothetical protein
MRSNFSVEADRQHAALPGARLAPILRDSTTAVAVAATLLAILPASASAAVTEIGSDLALPADRAEAHQADTVFWPVAFPDGRQVVSPVDGQVRLVRIRGFAQSDRTAPLGATPFGGERDFHIQVAEPLGDGTFRVRENGTSGDFLLPPKTGGTPDIITPYETINLCVRTGDIVIFNTVGGWDGVAGGTAPRPFPRGTPLQIFANAGPTSVVAEYEANGGTGHDFVLTGKPVAGRELLMRVTIGTGRHATGLCQGGTAGPEGVLPLDVPDNGPPPPPPGPPPPPPKVQLAAIPSSQRVTVSRKGKLSVSLFCKLTISRCTGKVRVLRRTGKPISLGSAKFDIAGKKTGHATIFLNKTGRRYFFKKGKGRLPVKLVAVTDPGGTTRTSSLLTTLRKR